MQKNLKVSNNHTKNKLLYMFTSRLLDNNFFMVNSLLIDSIIVTQMESYKGLIYLWKCFRMQTKEATRREEKINSLT